MRTQHRHCLVEQRCKNLSGSCWVYFSISEHTIFQLLQCDCKELSVVSLGNLIACFKIVAEKERGLFHLWPIKFRPFIKLYFTRCHAFVSYLLMSCWSPWRILSLHIFTFPIALNTMPSILYYFHMYMSVSCLCPCIQYHCQLDIKRMSISFQKSDLAQTKS